MEALLYFALWAGAIFLMMRFGCGAHVTGHGQGHDKKAEGEPGNVDNPALRWVPPAKDVDPVCGKTVATDRAKPSVHAGSVYYFCSRECREIFEAAPDQYLVGGNSKPRKLEHSPCVRPQHCPSRARARVHRFRYAARRDYRWSPWARVSVVPRPDVHAVRVVRPLVPVAGDEPRLGAAVARFHLDQLDELLLWAWSRPSPTAGTSPSSSRRSTTSSRREPARGPTVTEIRSLHGTTVAEILSAGLDNLEQIEAIAVSVLWKDGTVTAGCSNTTKPIWR